MLKDFFKVITLFVFVVTFEYFFNRMVIGTGHASLMDAVKFTKA